MCKMSKIVECRIVVKRIVPIGKITLHSLVMYLENTVLHRKSAQSLFKIKYPRRNWMILLKFLYTPTRINSFMFTLNKIYLFTYI